MFSDIVAGNGRYIHNLITCMYVCCMYVCMYACMYVCTYTCTYVYMQLHKHVTLPVPGAFMVTCMCPSAPGFCLSEAGPRFLCRMTKGTYKADFGVPFICDLCSVSRALKQRILDLMNLCVPRSLHSFEGAGYLMELSGGLRLWIRRSHHGSNAAHRRFCVGPDNLYARPPSSVPANYV